MINFKLLNFLDDNNLNDLRYQMNAILVPSFSQRVLTFLDDEELRKLGKDGIDIEDFNEIKVESDFTLSYKGQRVIVYIRDINHYSAQVNLPRFHFSSCSTLQSMKSNNRWHRYVVSNRDDGYFLVNHVEHNTSERSKEVLLNVCQNCLSQISWNGFDRTKPYDIKKKIVDNFNLKDFFDAYPKDIIYTTPRYTSDNAPINNYTDDWFFISGNLKKSKNYQCSQCKLFFHGDKKQFLHVHHINGEKNNNNIDNLEVLCIKCHAEEPMHSHMKNSKSYKDYLSLHFGLVE